MLPMNKLISISVLLGLACVSYSAPPLSQLVLSKVENYIDTRNYELITVSGVLTYFVEKNVELPARDGGFWIFSSPENPMAIIRFNNKKPIFYGLDSRDKYPDAVEYLAGVFKIELSDYRREERKAVLIMGLPSKPVEKDENVLPIFKNRDLPMVMWYPDVDAVVYLPK